MATEPSYDRTALRASLTALDDPARKVIGGLVALMIQHPGQVKDPEWMAEQLTQLVLLVRQPELEDLPDAAAGLAIVQAELQASGDEWMRLAFGVFTATAEDLASQVGEGLSRSQALAHALGYLMEAPGA